MVTSVLKDTIAPRVQSLPRHVPKDHMDLQLVSINNLNAFNALKVPMEMILVSPNAKYAEDHLVRKVDLRAASVQD